MKHWQRVREIGWMRSVVKDADRRHRLRALGRGVVSLVEVQGNYWVETQGRGAINVASSCDWWAVIGLGMLGPPNLTLWEDQLLATHKLTVTEVGKYGPTGCLLVAVRVRVLHTNQKPSKLGRIRL